MPNPKHAIHLYTPAEKQRIRNMIVALQAAREMLKSDGWYFICFALGEWNNKHKAAWSQQAFDDARSLVVRSIEPYATFDSKVRRMNSGMPYLSGHRSIALRVRWLNQLIADCQKAIS